MPHKTDSLGTNITKAKKLLLQHKVIAVPTETVYGLAVHPFHPHALQRLFTIKKRPYTKPLVLQTHNLDTVRELVQSIPPKAERLARAFWPGPLTLVLNKKPCIPDLLTAGKPTVGVRIPNHTLMLSLLEELDMPLAVTSANISGTASATTAQQVHKELGHSIAYVLDGGPCSLSIPSTIIGIKQNQLLYHRTGAISQSAIQEVVNKL